MRKSETTPGPSIARAGVPIDAAQKCGRQVLVRALQVPRSKEQRGLRPHRGVGDGSDE